MAINLFSIASVLLSITCVLLTVILFIFGKSFLHRIWILFNISVGLWAVGAFCISQTKSGILALSIWRIVEVSVVFIAIFFLHVTIIICRLNLKKLLFLSYIQGIIFSFVSLTSTSFFPGITFVFNSIYYPKAGWLFCVYFIIWMSLVGFSQFKLFETLFKSKGTYKNQLFYFGVATLVGFSGGATNFFPHFGINMYPFGNLTIILYCVLVTYAILRFQLLDIKIAVTRVGLFVFVYTLVLGIPFWLGIKLLGNGLWMIPAGVCVVLATVCPYVFLYFQRKAEAAILLEERKIQALLKKASVGMSAVRDVRKLLKLIVDVLIKNLHADCAAVYLFENTEGRYIRKCAEPSAYNKGIILNYESALIKKLNNVKSPIIYDEMSLLSDNDENIEAKEIIRQMQELSAAVIVPIIKENVLIGFITIGKRAEKQVYSAELLDILSIIGNDAAVNIENTLYIEAENKRLEDEGKSMRRMHLDTMVSTIAHEINNPMHIIDGEMESLSQICKEDLLSLGDLSALVIRKSQKVRNVAQGVAQLINNIRNFSKGQIHVEPINIDELMGNASVFIKYELKGHPDVEYKVNVEKNLPAIMADMSMTIEILRNFISNAIHATRGNVSDKKIILNINHQGSEYVRIEVVDNGYGINEETKKKLFETTYTSKSHTEGTGIGLWRIRKVCEFLRANYGFDSLDPGLGARF